MKRLFLFVALAGLFQQRADACTNLIVTRGASTDGSVMVSYAADSHQLYGALYKYNAPRKEHKPGTMLRVTEWDTGKYLGDIPQAPITYSTTGNMNEWGLIIGETTYGGLSELGDANGIMDYGSLIYISLQRAKTAREAIKTIADLAAEFGYASSGESFSIADSREVWIMEIQSKGRFGKGIVWVARRVPDGMVSGHANHPRITQFPRNTPDECLYSADVVSFARENGFYSGSDEAFSFSDVYAPLDFSGARGCEARVWSWFNRVADGMDKYTDYALGHNLANRMPLWVAPRAKVSPKQVFDMMRDHYEGTPMDMTRDVGAGGHRLPYRWRPMNFEVDGVTYVNERAIATQQTGFWFVGQSRADVPYPATGILWFGTDDAGTSPLTPIYSASTDVPWCLSTENGSMMDYSPTSMFWLTNRVTNFAYLRYDMIAGEIKRVIDEWENRQLVRVREFEAAGGVTKKSLTQFSFATAQELFDKWSKLDNYLLVKYIDGNVKKQAADGSFIDNGNGARIPAMPDMPGYDDRWKRTVAGQDDGTLRVK